MASLVARGKWWLGLCYLRPNTSLTWRRASEHLARGDVFLDFLQAQNEEKLNFFFFSLDQVQNKFAHCLSDN